LKKLLLISILSLFLGCASIGAVTPEMKSHMEVLKAKGIPFMIVAMYTGTPNSVGGVGTIVFPRITTPKAIKYISMTFSAYNEVGDKVVGSIKGNNTFTGKVTGPLNFGDKVHWWEWKNAWYNSSIHCIKLLSVEVEYMNGSEETYEGEDVTKLYAPEKFRMRDGVPSNRKKKLWSCSW